MIHATDVPALSAAERAALGARTLGSYLDEAPPHALAIVDGDARIDYVEYLDRVGRMAAAFYQLGVVVGDVVTVIVPNWWEGNVAMSAALRAGLVINPVTPIYRDAEVGFILAEAKTRVLVIPSRFRAYDYVAMVQRILPLLENPPLVVVARPEGAVPEGWLTVGDLLSQPGRIDDRAHPENVALLLYTSGTTAAPKGVLHTHQTLEYENRSIIDLFDLTAADTVFMPSPITHITGFLYGVLMPPMLGVASVLLDIWEPNAAAELVANEGCRFTLAATPFLQGLTDVHEASGASCSLSVFACGGADVPPDLVVRARRVLDATVVRVYGSSEFPTLSCGSPRDDERLASTTDGRLIGPVSCRLIDVQDGVGALEVRGPERFVGYLDATLNAGSFTDDGYFRTGDLARLEGDAVIISGRSKDVIIRGGENISVKEVEDLLYEHPAIRDVAVVAMPDPRLGEKACAFVVLVDGADLDLAGISEFLDGRHIAKQKYPERLEIVDELPRTATGKIQKFLLRDRLVHKA